MAIARKQFDEEAEAAYPALTRAAMILCHRSADVDDVVQETLVNAHKAFKSFRGDASFFSWCYRILVRVASKTNRNYARALPETFPTPRSQETLSADSLLIGNETHRLVIQSIRSLPERQREIATLHFIQELTYTEIAAAMKVSVGTVKATLFTAKQTLRTRLLRQGAHKT